MPNDLHTGAPASPVEQPAERCPHCGAETLRLIGERPHPLYGALGVTDRTWECFSLSCGKRIED